jgi:hypothetical protein
MPYAPFIFALFVIGFTGVKVFKQMQFTDDNCCCCCFLFGRIPEAAVVYSMF